MDVPYIARMFELKNTEKSDSPMVIFLKPQYEKYMGNYLNVVKARYTYRSTTLKVIKLEISTSTVYQSYESRPSTQSMTSPREPVP